MSSDSYKEKKRIYQANYRRKKGLVSKSHIPIKEQHGTMHHGHFAATRADTCMGAAFMNMLAVEMMQQED